MRSAEGFGVTKIIFSGYTPYPSQMVDSRLPHLKRKIDLAFHKTALGAESLVPNQRVEDVIGLIEQYKKSQVAILALEQSPNSSNLADFKLESDCLLILGEEVAGINAELLALTDTILEIPMQGQKESFNVSVAAGIALFQLTNKS